MPFFTPPATPVRQRRREADTIGVVLHRLPLAILTAAAALAQTPQAAPPKPSYRYAGRPIALQAQCGDAEIADFGMSCGEDEPCPVYLELTAVASAGVRLFTIGNLHTGTATLWSVLLASDDDGQSWTEPVDRLRGVAFDQVQFPDFATGIVAGHTAGALSRDPFVLRTADSGKTWSRSPILEEGSVGSIERLHFDSATHGVVQLDRVRRGPGRYATLETQDGGSVWTIRESSAERPSRPAGEIAPAVRIVADAPSKSFRIERHEENRWRTVAAFAVAAGACQTGNPTAPPEPPPPGQVH